MTTAEFQTLCVDAATDSDDWDSRESLREISKSVSFQTLDEFQRHPDFIHIPTAGTYGRGDKRH